MTPGTVFLTVQPAVAVPVAINRAYTTDEGDSLHIGGAGVLAGYTPETGVTLSARLVTNPAHGTVELNSDGSFTFIPAPGFTGTDQFGFQVTNGISSSNVAYATISVMSTGPQVTSVVRYGRNGQPAEL